VAVQLVVVQLGWQSLEDQHDLQVDQSELPTLIECHHFHYCCYYYYYLTHCWLTWRRVVLTCPQCVPFLSLLCQTLQFGTIDHHEMPLEQRNGNETKMRKGGW